MRRLQKLVLLWPVCVAFATAAICAAPQQFEFREGGIVRGPANEKSIALEFSADEFTEGGGTILDQLAAHRIKASFFLTGRCIRDPKNHSLIERMIRDGHYVGSHSDTHPLLCPWTGPKKTLVTKSFFLDEMNRSLEALEKFGVKRSDARYFIPPYEWYNQEIADWAHDAGLCLINFTPGTRSTADYTEDNAANFVSSKKIFDSIVAREKIDGLNGYLLLMHLGTGPKRTDKLYGRLGELIEYLEGKDYKFVRVDELLKS